MSEPKYFIHRTIEYKEWFKEEPPKSRFQITDRLEKIEYEGYFGNHKHLEDEVWELKFNDGRRIYYVYLKDSNVLLLLGGNKMGKIRTSPRRKTSTRSVASRKEKTLRNQESKELPSIEDFEGTERIDTRAYLINQENVGEAILDCLVNNDPEGVVEVISIYLQTLNKEKFRQKADIGKSTYYYLLKSKNPTIKTLAKIVHSIAH